MSRSWKKNPYRKSRRFDKTCRCNGSCPYCRENRLHSIKKRLLEAEEQIKETNGRVIPDREVVVEIEAVTSP